MGCLCSKNNNRPRQEDPLLGRGGGAQRANANATGGAASPTTQGRRGGGGGVGAGNRAGLNFLRTEHFPNGHYHGQFNNNGLKHGKGRYTWNNGQYYDGDWKNDLMDGQGVYEWPDGRKYQGAFKEDEFEGRGTYFFADGSKFTGPFAKSNINGRGTYTTDAGEALEVDWEDVPPGDAVWMAIERVGVIDPNVLMPAAPQETFQERVQREAEERLRHQNQQREQREREQREARRPGMRTERYQNGMYHGEFTSGYSKVKQGKGTYTWHSGQKYTGDWFNDKMHGKGVYEWPDGRRYEGEFRNDEFEGHGVYEFGDRSKYEGPFHDSLLHGRGKYTSDNGEVFHVQWEAVEPTMAVWMVLDRVGVVAAPPPNNGNAGVAAAANNDDDQQQHRNDNNNNRRPQQNNNNGAANTAKQPPPAKNVKRFPNGNYTGDLLQPRGYRNGKGRFEADAGDVYDGQWREDCMHGEGRYTWPDTSAEAPNGGPRTYEGTFFRNMIHGQGTLVWEKEGAQFRGNFENGKLCNGVVELLTPRRGIPDARPVAWRQLDVRTAFERIRANAALEENLAATAASSRERSQRSAADFLRQGSASAGDFSTSGGQTSFAEQMLCVICLSEPKTHLLVPCGHLVLCEACAAEVKGKMGQCPVCRANCQMVIKLYK